MFAVIEKLSDATIRVNGVETNVRDVVSASQPSLIALSSMRANEQRLAFSLSKTSFGLDAVMDPNSYSARPQSATFVCPDCPGSDHDVQGALLPLKKWLAEGHTVTKGFEWTVSFARHRKDSVVRLYGTVERMGNAAVCFDGLITIDDKTFQQFMPEVCLAADLEALLSRAVQRAVCWVCFFGNERSGVSNKMQAKEEEDEKEEEEEGAPPKDPPLSTKEKQLLLLRLAFALACRDTPTIKDIGVRLDRHGDLKEPLSFVHTSPFVSLLDAPDAGQSVRDVLGAIQDQAAWLYRSYATVGAALRHALACSSPSNISIKDMEDANPRLERMGSTSRVGPASVKPLTPRSKKHPKDCVIL